MDIHNYRLISRVEAAGMDIQMRMWPRTTTDTITTTTPTDVLTYRIPPAAKLWSRAGEDQDGEFVLAGPVTFRPRFTTWQTRTNGAPQMTLAIKFERPLKYAAPRHGVLFSFYESSMIALMDMLVDEMREPGFSSAALFESVGTVLRVKLRRHMFAGPNPERKASPLGDDKLGMLHEYILMQKGRTPTVTELAQLCELSSRSLLRQFRARTGSTVADYITQIQLEKSKALLMASSQMVKQIAFEVGFTDPNHFSTAFKRLVGMTPLQFRDARKR